MSRFLTRQWCSWTSFDLSAMLSSWGNFLLQVGSSLFWELHVGGQYILPGPGIPFHKLCQTVLATRVLRYGSSNDSLSLGLGNLKGPVVTLPQVSEFLFDKRLARSSQDKRDRQEAGSCFHITAVWFQSSLFLATPQFWRNEDDKHSDCLMVFMGQRGALSESGERKLPRIIVTPVQVQKYTTSQ